MGTRGGGSLEASWIIRSRVLCAMNGPKHQDNWPGLWSRRKASHTRKALLGGHLFECAIRAVLGQRFPTRGGMFFNSRYVSIALAMRSTWLGLAFTSTWRYGSPADV